MKRSCIVALVCAFVVPVIPMAPSAAGEPSPAAWHAQEARVVLSLDFMLLAAHDARIDIHNQLQAASSADGQPVLLYGNADSRAALSLSRTGVPMLDGRIALEGGLLIQGPAGQVRVQDLSLGVSSAALALIGNVDGQAVTVFDLNSAKQFFDEAADSFLFESSELRLADSLAERIGAAALADQSVGFVRGQVDGAAALGATQALAEAFDRSSNEVAGGNNGTICPAPVGPDIIVGDLFDVANYTSNGGIEAFTVGTYSCNVGNQNAIWIANNNQHPVIGQNMFRLKNGTFEHIGQAWLKHGFLALTDNICGCGCNGQGGSVLGVGCADPYTAGLNGQQDGMGPKWQVNAWSGVFTWPFQGDGQTGNSIFKRIQVNISDLEAAGSGSSTHYYLEGQYVSPDDSAFGNQDNNASYRRVFVSGSGSAWNISFTGAPGTVREKPAIRAWRAADPTVKETDVRVPNEGLFVLASKVTDLGNGFWHYEYALQNLNSDRSGQSFSVSVPSSVTVQNIGFRDVPYHSGEPFDGTDWSILRTNSAVVWSTDSHATNANANALRWGTLYNFRFDADTAPTNTFATLGLFKPGTPTSLTFTIEGPGECSTDEDCDDDVFCNGQEVCVAESGTCRDGSAPCAAPQVCDENNDICVGALGCGECRRYTDLATPFCLVDITDVLAALAGYGEDAPCTTMFGGRTPGSEVWDGGCWVPCETDADCVGSLGMGVCVGGECCDVCDISDLVAALNAYSEDPGCVDPCPPGACNFDLNQDTVADCCKDGSSSGGGMSESQCQTQGGVFLGDYSTCGLPQCKP